MSSEKGFTIYVAEDNEWYNKLIVHNLSRNPDFVVKGFVTGKELLDNLSDQPEVVTIDYRLPDINGDELLAKIKAFNPTIEVIVISEQDEIEVAVELLKQGAADYIVKSKDIQERLLKIVNNVRSTSKLKKEIISLKKEVKGKYAFEKTMIGKSKPMEQVFEFMSKAIATNINVTITGETGTGKEVVAKAIHYNSYCADKPFVAINMAAIPADLLESELFGHEKGAFTGANARRIGKFEEAGEGTLFLDEIGEMDIVFQAKLLRALQEREIVRVGSNKPIKINCRIIVATNRTLQKEVQAGNFREDLYFRLIGLPIHLPPLKERGKDVLILAKHFINGFCKTNNLPEKGLSEDAQRKLLSYQWPGNIREVKSVVELGVVMSSSDQITASDLSLNSEDALPNVLTEELSLREYNRRIVNLYMDKYSNDTKVVAEKLDIGQTTVYRLLKEMSEK
ncbi:MAG: sigma-54 dependent transcriptional regulator [Crocinitomicaceae bacterium]